MNVNRLHPGTVIHTLIEHFTCTCSEHYTFRNIAYCIYNTSQQVQLVWGNQEGCKARSCTTLRATLGEIFNPGMLNPVTQRLAGAGWY